MIKRKLHSRILRKEILSACVKPLHNLDQEYLPWFIARGLIRDHSSSLGSLAETFASAVSTRDPLAYLELQKFADPQLYESADTYFGVASVVSLLKKYPFDKVTGLDPESAAKRSFYRAEKLCKIANKRLAWYLDKGFRLDNKRQRFYSVFHTARRLIASWLGEVDLNKIYSHTRHGPGGSIGVTGDATTRYFKYRADQYTVTLGALPYAEAAILADPLWRRYCVNPESILGDAVPSVSDARASVLRKLKVIDYNKVTFVPKTAQTHRAIAIEPTMNVFLQLGVGDLLTSILQKVGTNLKSQARNQFLARDGSSWSGASDLCPVTLDLSMASDTLSYNLVKDLLPTDWFTVLDALRSPNGLLDGASIPYEKFSSMGNGFTFQLESMIFRALSQSVAIHLNFEPSTIAIYGDDIIVPRGMALFLVDVLAFAGFSVNREKSFFFGPFRESCGSDWFKGRNVRPFFLKRKIQNARDLVFIINSLGDPRHYGQTDFNTVSLDLYQRLPRVVKTNLLGPPCEDKEGHIHCPLDFAQQSKVVVWDRGIQAWSFASVKASPVHHNGDAGPLFLQLMDNSSASSPLCNFGSDLRGLALNHDSWVLSPLKNGVVSYRNRTRCGLTTLTESGWRNV